MIAAIASFFGMVIRFIYSLVNSNYFLSIIIFTLLTKIILFPLLLKQIKSTEEMKKIAPKDKQIREKYKNDKAKQSEELTKLYSEHKINPLGGCLPLLIQIPIVFAMFYIVKQPLTYILQVPQEEIRLYTQEVLEKENVTTSEMQQNEILVANKKELIDMNVGLGINLGNVPSNAFSKDESKKVPIVSLVIPILAVIFAGIQNKLSQKNMAMSDEQKEMQKTNNIMLPLLSGFISYTMPLALGVYWLFGNILQIIQQIVINRYIIKKDENLTLEKGGVINEKD
jgi:YidC/Oxa1 family membrane protein insertase